MRKNCLKNLKNGSNANIQNKITVTENVDPNTLVLETLLIFFISFILKLHITHVISILTIRWIYKNNK
jgi:hypothetical protein